ncbi:MAG TPA: hypothetical protein PK095_14180 [Myxococcota bacterium]|nr:hypothetical protein [Myxococcota bacterium]
MLRRLVLGLTCTLVACDSDPAPADSTDTAEVSSEVADAADSASPDAAVPDSTDPDTSTGDTTAPDTSLPDTTAPDATLAEVLVDCHGLDYAITCDKPAPDANGYLACSDYFGNTMGVVAQCSAGATVDVREGGPACAGYTHYVGSCVYFVDTPATRDRCYVTHVGATTADKIEAGRNFWRVACAGGWVETLE